MLLHAEGVEGRANHRRSPTGARSPFCPHTPLAERQPEKEKRKCVRRKSNCEALKSCAKKEKVEVRKYWYWCERLGVSVVR